MRKRVLISLFSLFFIIPLLYSKDELRWKRLRGSDFFVYFLKNKILALKVLHQAERDYDRIAATLGYRHFNEFWNNEKINIYIYPDKKLYLKYSQSPNWSAASTNYRKRAINIFLTNNKYNPNDLSHEIAHMVFRDFVKFRGKIPLWLDEAVAQFLEKDSKEKAALAREYLKEQIKKNNFFSLEELSDMKVNEIKDIQKVNLFYQEAISLIDFLITRYGITHFRNFCIKLRDGLSFSEALRIVYPYYVDEPQRLQKAWLRYILD